MTTTSKSWIVKVTVTDHGAWNPADEKACADLIAAVNDLRKPGNERPCIRRSWWSNDEHPWLDVEIDRTSIRLDAGDHLVCTVMPDGSTEWSAVDGDDLAKLLPGGAL